jgi:hypothetical protein
MTQGSREELRAELVARIPRWYSPWAHAVFPAAAGAVIAVLALSRVHGLRPWQAALAPLFLLACNAVEWHAHRGLLHRRTRFLEVLYVRHTPQHHQVFVADDMGLRQPRELRLVLMPAYAILVIVAAASPVALALAWVGQPNLAALWIATAAFYVVAYECLHLAYHLPPDSPIGRSRIVAHLRRHHQAHHAPHLMHRWNFNVTIPVWDLVRGTAWRRSAVASAVLARRTR